MTPQASRLPRHFCIAFPAHISIYMEMASCCEQSPLQSATLTASPKGTPSARASSCPRVRGKWPAGPKGVNGRGPAHILIYIEMTSCCERSPLQSAALTASPKGTPSARAPSLLRARRRWPEGPEEVHGRTGKNNPQLQALASVAAPRTGKGDREAVEEVHGRTGKNNT